MRLRYKQLGHSNMFGDAIRNLFSKPAQNQDKGRSGEGIDVATFKFHPITGKPITKEEPFDPFKKDQGTGEDKNKQTTGSTPQGIDIFKGMFDTTAATRDDAKAPSFSLDPEKLKTLVGAQDFTAHLTSELQEKLKSGDPQATKEALNSLGQSVYSRALEHLPALTEAYVNARMDHANKGLGKSVKSTMTKESLAKLAADNPVLKRQLDVVGEQLLTAYPDATPEWVAEQVPNYFLTMAKMLSPDAFKPTEGNDDTSDSSKPGPADVDWVKWMSGQGTASSKT